ncbi:MAG: hypothetical protein ACI4DU_05330, partial [Lachnospiraceae bacterium]
MKHFLQDCKKITKKQYMTFAILTVCAYVFLLFLYHGKQLGIHAMLQALSAKEQTPGQILALFFRTLPQGLTGHFGEVRKVVFLLVEILFAIIIVGPKKFFRALFRYRWAAGILLLAFLTVNRYHGDSLGAYNFYIQPGIGNEFTTPLFGQVRLIRSDEWAVSTPAKISSSFGEDAFGQYNSRMRGTDTVNGINGIYLGYATLAKNILYFAYGIMDVEYAFSFVWCGQIIFAYLIAVEFFLVLTKKKALPAVAGATLCTFSSFYLWWGFPAVLWSSQLALLGFAHFLQSDKKWKRCIFALLFSLGFAAFCTILYPAWQVPFGYIALALAVSIGYDNLEQIKKLRIVDILIFVVAIVFAGSLIVSYLKINADYLLAVTQTVYPGKRISNGDFGIRKVFYYVQSLFYGYKEVANSSESTAFFSLFPLPVIFGFISWWKRKKENFGSLLLCILAVIFTLYCTTGLPMAFCRITLLSNCVSYRVVDAIGYICVLLLVLWIADALARQPVSADKRKKTFVIAILSIGTAVLSVVSCIIDFPDYFAGYQRFLITVFLCFFAYGIFQQKKVLLTKFCIIMLIVISFVTGLSVRPLMKGFDAIWSKPVADEIKEIVREEEDATWIALGNNIAPQGFLLSCGARCKNSTNFYPNLSMWYALDPEKECENIYNRYCHVGIKLTEEPTEFVLGEADSVLI